jgi:glycine hydroxymethyltransferase
MAQGIQLVSGGTDNHMMLADLTSLNTTGKDAEAVLGRAGITVNKNTIPFETKSPFVTSGIRLGTSVLTTRGMGKAEMTTIAELIVAVLKHPEDETVISSAADKVAELCNSFPLYAWNNG